MAERDVRAGGTPRGRELRVDPVAVARSVIEWALVLQFVALVGDLVFNFWDVTGSLNVRRIFNIAREQSFPTWLASLQAALVAATAWWLGRLSGRRSWYWVGAFFLYVSIDDAAEVHERVASTLSDRFPTVFESYPSFSWHLFIAPFLAAGLFLVAVHLWRRVPSRSTRLLVAAALGGFAISQGIDVLEGIDGLWEGWAGDLGVADYTVGHSLRTVEEMLEMLSTTALWAPMLFAVAAALDDRDVRLEGTPNPFL